MLGSHASAPFSESLRAVIDAEIVVLAS